MSVVREGDYVLLYHSPKVKVVTRALRNKKVETIRGSIDLSSVIGLEHGSKVRSSLGFEFTVTRPRLDEIMMREYKRPTQVIYLKDAAYIIVRSGIGPGSVVIEAGVGSGFMTTMLSYYVRPDGKVIGFERREEFLEIARENLKKTGLLRWVELRHRDVVESGFDVEDESVDCVILDLDRPWDVLKESYRVLKHGCTLAIYVPSVLQVKRVLESYQSHGFIDPEVVEVIVRSWKTVPDELRPETWALSHTGFMVFLRKP